jgi:hypothetical protein
MMCFAVPNSNLLKNVLQEMIIASSKFSTTEVCILFSPVIVIICSTENRFLQLDEMKLVSSQGAKEKRFLYDIVANGRNGIDVDK